MNTLSGLNPQTSGLSGLSGLSGVNGVNGASGASGISGIGGIGGVNGVNGLNGLNGYQPYGGFDVTRCPKPTDMPKTDEEKEEEEKFRKHILSNNPYQLNRFGVSRCLELPAMPVAGLTASEATRRLNTDPEFADWYVRLTLLRLHPSGARGLEALRVRSFRGRPQHFRTGLRYSGPDGLHGGSRRYDGHTTFRQRIVKL